MRLIRFELYRAFHSTTFITSLTIGTAICLLDLIFFYNQFGESSNTYLIQAWIGADYQFVFNEMFFILLPVLASLPYGSSLYSDIETGYDKNICVKVSRMKYCIAKKLAVFISGFVTIAIPLGLNLFIAAGLFPNYSPERLEFMSLGLMDRNMFAYTYSQHPVVYCLLFILIDSGFAGVIALTSLSISRAVRSRFTAIVTPMVIYIISGMILEGDDRGNWGIIGMVNPRQYVTTRWYQMLIAFAAILVVNTLVIRSITRKRDII